MIARRRLHDGLDRTFGIGIDGGGVQTARPYRAAVRGEPGELQPILYGRDGSGQRGHHREPPADQVGDVGRTFGDVEYGDGQHFGERIPAVLAEPGHHNSVEIEVTRFGQRSATRSIMPTAAR